MSAITQAVFDRLVNDVTLTGLLGAFGGNPSIFTQVPLPSGLTLEANGPYILTTGDVSQDPGSTDTKNSSGRELVRDIRCFTDLNKSASDVEAIAERVRALFHRQTFTITGFTVVVSEVTGPIEADEEDALGRIVTVRLVLTEP